MTLNSDLHAETTADRIAKTFALGAVLDALPSMVTYWDRHCICQFANKSYLEWFGRSPEGMIGLHISEFLGPQRYAISRPYIDKVLLGEAQQFERTMTKADGSIGHTLANYVPQFDADGVVSGFFVQVNDVTLLKTAQDRLIRAEARLQAILDSATDSVVAIDRDGVIESVNPSTSHLFGYQPGEMVGQRIQILFGEPPGPHRGSDAEQGRFKIEPHKAGIAREALGVTRDGRRFPIELKVTKPVVASDDLYVVFMRDITDQKLAQEQLTRAAMTDGLTGLANRRRFDEVLAAEYGRHSAAMDWLSLIMIDVDYFKLFNDLYGHLAGDDCLRKVARVLDETVRRAGDLTARFGGEEFACVLPMTDHKSARDLAEIIRQKIAQMEIPHELSRAGRHVTVSVGVATSRCPPGGTPTDLLGLADQQLYAAKSSGRNRYSGAEL